MFTFFSQLCFQRLKMLALLSFLLQLSPQLNSPPLHLFIFDHPFYPLPLLSFFLLLSFSTTAFSLLNTLSQFWTLHLPLLSCTAVMWIPSGQHIPSFLPALLFISFQFDPDHSKEKRKTLPSFKAYFQSWELLSRLVLQYAFYVWLRPVAKKEQDKES